jgi:starch-binding outer membrane protein, SusD/RagB family
MKNLLKYTFVSALVLGAFSCTDLEEEIKDSYTENFTPANQGVGSKNNVNKATPNDGLTAAFTRVLNGTAWHGSYFSIQEISSDEAVITQKGGDWFDGGIWLTMHKHQFASTGLGGINGAWEDTYGGIFQCNDLLKNGDLTDAGKAQLRFLRAYFYWRLVDTFGNVKIVTEPGVDVPQTTRLQVYNFIEAELLAAIPDLPAGKQEYGRANQSGAYALLSRLYLNAKVYKGLANFDNADLQKAIDAADEVINSGLYELDDDYAKVFSPDNVENSEHIFVAPFDEATGGGMNFAQMTLHYPSQLTFKLAQQPWNGYSTLEEFYNSYEASDERRTNNFIVGPQKDVNGNPILDLAFDKADPDGAEINYTPFINELAPNGSRQAGARLGKFSFKIGQNNDMDNDFPLLRLGEVILNKAEALHRLGQTGNAETEINKLRTRANVGSIAPLTEGKLLAERGRELFQESLRRTDLIRFGAWGNAWWEKPAHSDANKNLFPIPNEQIQATAPSPCCKLTQNPGY